jgi:atypical dual specificity phosphatase
MPSFPDAVREPDSYWLIPGRLMGGEWPVPYLDWLASQRVSVLINLTPRVYEDDRFRIHRLPLKDGAAPDEAQIGTFCRLVRRELLAKNRVYVHCIGGYGRTGTMMACYWIYRYRDHHNEAIRQIRVLRPGSIENSVQENAVAQWALLMQASDYRLSGM